jgi:hypothetical protein
MAPDASNPYEILGESNPASNLGADPAISSHEAFDPTKM